MNKIIALVYYVTDEHLNDSFSESRVIVESRNCVTSVTILVESISELMSK